MQAKQQNVIYRSVNQPCWIHAGPDQAAITCRLVGITERDAKIECTEPTEIAHEFILMFTEDGQVARKCFIVERLDGAIELKIIGKAIVPRGDVVRVE